VSKTHTLRLYLLDVPSVDLQYQGKIWTIVTYNAEIRYIPYFEMFILKFATQNIQSYDPNLDNVAITISYLRHISCGTFSGSLRDKKIQTVFLTTKAFLLSIVQNAKN
jgi:hypothetical protein